MADAPIPEAIAASPLGARLTWLLHHVRVGDAEPTDAQLEAIFATQWMRLDRVRESFARINAAMPGATLVDVRPLAPHAAVATLDVDGHTWNVIIVVEKGPPHRIRNVTRAERVPGVVIRDATDADAAMLRQIELQTPVVSGDVSVVYDRGEDYFEAEHLMGDAVTHVVELEGRPVGLTSWVLHPVRVNGITMLGGFKHKMRLMKDARGLGARQMLDFAGSEVHAAQRDLFYTYSAAGNDNVHHIYGESAWNVRPERVVINTRRNAGPAAGRPCTSTDGQRVIQLLNRTHRHEEMFVPYGLDSLGERLGRVSAAYSWRNLRISDHAVLGVWPAHLNVVRTASGDTTTDDRALVLDYGYDEGAQGELIALVHSECATLAAAGSTELAMFTCPQASVHSQLAAMSKRIEPYMIHTSIPPPDDLNVRGLYVDHLYF